MDRRPERLEWPLTEIEKALAADELARALGERDRIKDERTHALAGFKERTEAVAEKINRLAAEVRSGSLQLGGEADELGTALLGVRDLGGDQLMEVGLYRPAVVGLPQLGEVSDLIELAAELLGPVDEAQSLQ